LWSGCYNPPNCITGAEFHASWTRVELTSKHVRAQKRSQRLKGPFVRAVSGFLLRGLHKGLLARNKHIRAARAES